MVRGAAGLRTRIAGLGSTALRPPPIPA
jgi:hypothetical protein